MWGEKAIEALREMVKCIEADKGPENICFDADFMEVLNAFLMQLLTWASSTQESTMRARAGNATAGVFKLLHDNRKALEGNESFRRTDKGLRKLKNLRTTQAGRYVDDEVWRAAMDRSWTFTVKFLSAEDQRLIRKVSKPGEYARVYSQIDEFGPDTAREWFDKIIWPRLQKREDEFLSEPEIEASQTFRSAVAKKGSAYLSDFNKQFWQATQALAKRPKGFVRGVHRPHW